MCVYAGLGGTDTGGTVDRIWGCLGSRALLHDGIITIDTDVILLVSTVSSVYISRRNYFHI